MIGRLDNNLGSFVHDLARRFHKISGRISQVEHNSKSENSWDFKMQEQNDHETLIHLNNVYTGRT